VLTASGLVNGNPSYSTHTESTSLHQSKFAKFGGKPSMGGLWANR